jgi:hypothetical protein
MNAADYAMIGILTAMLVAFVWLVLFGQHLWRCRFCFDRIYKRERSRKILYLVEVANGGG